MKKEHGELIFRMRNLFVAAGLAGSLFSGQTVYAFEENVVQNILEADPIYVGDTLNPEQEPFVEFDGEITDNNQLCEYMYTAPKDANYYFGVTNLKTNCSVRFELYDSLGNRICNSAGSYVTLEEGETYTIQISMSGKDITPFTVQVRPPRDAIDITDATIINDEITLQGQTNAYLFTAPRDGNYNFSLSDTTANINFSLKGWNQYDKQILSTQSSETAELEEGVTYRINVSYNNGVGKYSLNVLEQKPMIDITGYTDIHDSLDYEKQLIYYSFTAPISGTYTMMLTDTNTIGHFDYSIIDENGYTVAENDYKSPDSEIEKELDEGNYVIRISTYRWGPSYGTYTWEISYPSSAQQYLEDFSLGIIDANSLKEENVSDVTGTENEESSKEDLILEQLESLQSEMNELKDENEMLKNALDENEIEYD